MHRTANSCLYRAFGAEACVAYNPDLPISAQRGAFPAEIPGAVVVAHSFGFAAFIAARASGLLRNAARLIVIDGFYPLDRTWAGRDITIELPSDCPCIFFFPSFGDRSRYPLEAVVRQAMITRLDLTVVRGIGFGHNLLYGSFKEPDVCSLVARLAALPDTRESEADIAIHMPQ